MRFVLLGLRVAGVAPAAQPPLLGESVVAALASELSGESAKHNLEVISAAHPMRASRGFRDAAQFVAGRSPWKCRRLPWSATAPLAS